MTQVAINTTILGREKPTVLPVTIANVKKSLEYRGKVFDMNKSLRKLDSDDMSQSAYFDFLAEDNEFMAKRLDETVRFLKDILVITDEEYEKMLNLDVDDILALCDEVNRKLMNPTDEQVDDDENATPSKP